MIGRATRRLTPISCSTVTDVNDILTQFMKTSPKVPIQIIAPGGGDYVCVYFDHGVGDAHLIIELFTALSQAGAYADFVPPIPGSLKTPLLTCFASATKADPKGMWTEALELGKTFLGRRGAPIEEAPLEVPAETPRSARRRRLGDGRVRQEPDRLRRRVARISKLHSANGHGDDVCHPFAIQRIPRRRHQHS